MKKEHVAVLCLIALAIGFYCGRKTISYETEIRYVQGDVVRDTVLDIRLVSEFIPSEPELIYSVDTFYMDNMVFVEAKVDSTAIFNEYIARREYATVLFDTPTLGKLSIFETIQYNRPTEKRYDFVPIYKETTKYRIKTWQPYFGASFNTFNQAVVSAGTFYKNTGVDLQYIHDFDLRKKGYGLGIMYRF